MAPVLNKSLYTRKRRARAVLRIILSVMVLVTLFVMGMLLGAFLFSPSTWIPAVEKIHALGDEDATDRLSRYTAGDLKQAWGEPLKDSTVYYEKFSGDCRRYIWKLPDDMDYLCVFTSLNNHEILDVICCHVFKGYPVYEASDLTWGTVTPLPDEEEAAYGELIRINFFSNHPVVLEYLDQGMPVIIYYTGYITKADGEALPTIDSVFDMQFYDYDLEPLDTD